MEKHYQNYTEVIIAGSEFDAMWAMALGLHEAAERVSLNDSTGCDNIHTGEMSPLEDFDYLNDKMGCVLNESFKQVNFVGVTVSGSIIALYMNT